MSDPAQTISLPMLLALPLLACAACLTGGAWWFDVGADAAIAAVGAVLLATLVQGLLAGWALAPLRRGPAPTHPAGNARSVIGVALRREAALQAVLAARDARRWRRCSRTWLSRRPAGSRNGRPSWGSSEDDGGADRRRRLRRRRCTMHGKRCCAEHAGRRLRVTGDGVRPRRCRPSRHAASARSRVRVGGQLSASISEIAVPGRP